MTRRKVLKDDGPNLQNRILIVGLLMFIGIFVLVIYNFSVQMGSGDMHKKRVAKQTMRRIRIPPKRGKIFSSDDVVFAENRPRYDLVFYPSEMRKNRRARTIANMMEAAEDLSRTIGRECPIKKIEVMKHINTRPGMPMTIFRDLSTEEIAKLYEGMRRWEGADIVTDTVRVYPQGRRACHLIGFSRLENADGAEDKNDFFYYVPDSIGIDGVEKYSDTPDDIPVRGVRGVPGYSLVQVDHLGYVNRTLIEKIEPTDGNNIIMTLDSRAQRIAETILEGNVGSIVLIDADNGDILAAASSPGYDLSKFTPKLTGSYYSSLLNDPRRPLMNRAMMGAYTPGSILKPLVCLGYLCEGVDPKAEIYCDGYNEVGNAKIRCAAYRHGGHGKLDMVESIKLSCNSYMIQNSQIYGRKSMEDILKNAGIGRKTGVGIPESAGVFPSPEAKERIFKTKWNAYDTALLSMGQGVITLTPLQAALFAGAISNGGTVWHPHLIKSIVDTNGKVKWERKPLVASNLGVTAEQLEVVRRGMHEVVNAGDGSGRRALVDGLDIYGKTGSAEVGVKPNLKINAWFISFTRYMDKNYAAAIILEDAQSGGRSCAPMAASLYDQYLFGEYRRTD